MSHLLLPFYHASEIPEPLNVPFSKILSQTGCIHEIFVNDRNSTYKNETNSCIKY